MFTSSCIATLALRMRVSMSAIGSVIIGRSLLSPARLGQAADLAGVGEVAHADAAQTELPVHRPRPAAAAATGVGAHLELRLGLLLVDQCPLGHLRTSSVPVTSSAPAGRRGRPCRGPCACARA